MDGRPTRVLLVEDDRDTREMYTAYLSYSGLDVAPIDSARGALETARFVVPDVIVTDIAMPEMDGLELSRRLRAEEPTRSVPIIAVSGNSSARAREAGCDVVLSKPCMPDELLGAIRTVLAMMDDDADGGAERGWPTAGASAPRG